LHHHHHTDYVEVVSAKGPATLSSKWRGIFIFLAVLGFGAFIYQGFLVEGTERIGWIAFLHNLYFFTGLSAAGVVIAAIIQVTRAFWGRPIKRYAEAMGAFLPVSILLLCVLYFGADHIYEWIGSPPHEGNKHLWLQKNFMFIRVILGLGILTFVAHRFSKLSLRPDLGLAHEKNPEKWTQPANWQGTEAEVEDSQKKQSKWGVIYCFCFAFIISLLSFDLIMSLDYKWFSTMFGGWNFTTFMLTAWGSLVLITYFMSKCFGVDHYINKYTYHDLGKLTFGFTVVWGYLFFAQYNVIWYGNLPHETGYLLTRFYDPAWRPFSLIVLVMVFILPFLLGLGKKRKMSPKTFAPIVVISFVGVWLERFLLIAPSAWYFDRHQMAFEPGIAKLLVFDVLVFLGFFGLWALMFTNRLFKNPVMVISDPKLSLGINRH